MTKLNKRLLVGVITLMLLITSLFGFYFFTNYKTVSADSTAIDKQSTLFEPYAAEESNSERFVLNGNVLVKYNGTDEVLTESDFPAGVKTIASGAFKNNSALKKVYLPNSVMKIEAYAFEDCASLTVVRYLNNFMPILLGELVKNVNADFSIYLRRSVIENEIHENTWWNNYKAVLKPFVTDGYFEGLNKHVTIYYGDPTPSPEYTRKGFVFNGWKKVNNNGETYGEALNPWVSWQVAADEITFRAEFVPIEKNLLIFKNGQHIIGHLEIVPGETLELNQYGYTLDGNSQSYVGRNFMDECNYGDYSGAVPVDKNGAPLATFNGWLINGKPFTGGEWKKEYTRVDLIVTADWKPVEFDLTLQDDANNVAPITIKTNYFEKVALPASARNDYDFLWWKNADGMIYKENIEWIDKDTVLTAVYAEKTETVKNGHGKTGGSTQTEMNVPSYSGENEKPDNAKNTTVIIVLAVVALVAAGGFGAYFIIRYKKNKN